MIIRDEGYTITDVPGVDYIKVKPEQDGRVIVRTKDEAMENERAWDVEQLKKYLAALGRAVALAETIQAQNQRDAS